jgi:hypothetical protein
VVSITRTPAPLLADVELANIIVDGHRALLCAAGLREACGHCGAQLRTVYRVSRILVDCADRTIALSVVCAFV